MKGKMTAAQGRIANILSPHLIPPQGFKYLPASERGVKNEGPYQYTSFKVKEEEAVELDALEVEMLEEEGYKIMWVSDHVSGLMIIDRLGRKQRLGRVARRLEKSWPSSAKSLARKIELRTNNSFEVIISAEPNDLLTMSEGRGWASCIGFGGCNFGSVFSAIRCHDLVAYAVKPGTDWLARIWLRFDGEKGWWQESQIYGNGVNEAIFRKAVSTFLSENGAAGTPGQFSPDAWGWSDFFMDRLENSNPSRGDDGWERITIRRTWVESKGGGWWPRGDTYVWCMGEVREEKRVYLILRIRPKREPISWEAIQEEMEG